MTNGERAVIFLRYRLDSIFHFRHLALQVFHFCYHFAGQTAKLVIIRVWCSLLLDPFLADHRCSYCRSFRDPPMTCEVLDE